MSAIKPFFDAAATIMNIPVTLFGYTFSSMQLLIYFSLLSLFLWLIVGIFL